MRFGALIGEVSRSLFKKPVTELYPVIRKDAPVTLRGRLNYNAATCVGCKLCVMNCPSKAIEIITINKAEKRFVMRYHVDRCIFCKQCVQECRFNCLTLSSEEWELAATGKNNFELLFGREEDVKALKEAANQPNNASNT